MINLPERQRQRLTDSEFAGLQSKQWTCPHCGNVNTATTVNMAGLNRHAIIPPRQSCECAGYRAHIAEIEACDRRLFREAIEYQEGWQKITPAGFTHEQVAKLAKAKAKILKWVIDRRPALMEDEKIGDLDLGLFIAGDNGTGKTTMTRAVMMGLRSLQVTVKIIKEGEISDILTSNDDNEKTGMVKSVSSAQLLIIDDLMELSFNEKGDWVKQLLYNFYGRVLERRARFGRPVIFSSNKTLAQTSAKLLTLKNEDGTPNKRPYSRFMEVIGAGEVVDMFGLPDHRTAKRGGRP